MRQVLPIVHPPVTKTVLKKRSSATLLQVHGLNICIEQHVDKSGKRSIGFLPQEEVIVIGHQAICNDRGAIILKVPHGEAKEKLIIARVEEDLPPTCAAIEDMIILARANRSPR